MKCSTVSSSILTRSLCRRPGVSEVALRVATTFQSCCPCQTLTLMTSPCLTSLLSLRENCQTCWTNEVRLVFCAVLHHELTPQADDAKDTAQAEWPCQWIAVSDDSEPTAVIPVDMMPFEVEFDTGMFLRSACMPATHEVYVYCRFRYEVSLLRQFNVLGRCSTDWSNCSWIAESNAKEYRDEGLSTSVATTAQQRSDSGEI